MGQDFESDHFKLMKDIHKDMKDFVVEGFTQSCSEIGESGFTRDMFHGDTLRGGPEAGIGAISPTSILVPKDTKEMAHILMTVDISEKVKQK